MQADALSSLMNVLRFEGGVFLDAVFRAPWCIRSEVTEDDCGFPIGANCSLVAFHFVLDGSAQVVVGNGKPQPVSAGDLVLLRDNSAHLIGSDTSLAPIPAEKVMQQLGEHALSTIDFGTGEIVSRIVCGFLISPLRNHPLLTALPSVLKTSTREGPGAAWVESSFRFAAREHASRRPASQSMVARLAELLFVEALREHIEHLPTDATGWLAAVRDPPLGRALAALQSRVDHPWTTEELAEHALMSRSAFAERFVRTLGMPPMTYLTNWRMLIAAQRLRESPAPIARIAAEVGYESEATFTRAFSRQMGVPPGRFRKSA